jgi:hypothetical protein
MIGDGFFDCSALENKPCFNVNSLTLNNGSITVITNSTQIGPSFQTVNIVGNAELYFEYLSESSKEEFTGIPLIHLDSISLPSVSLYKLMIEEIKGKHEREIIFDAGRLQGCGFSVESVGNYSISVESDPSEWKGHLVHNESLVFSVNGSWDNFYSDVSFVLSATPSSGSAKSQSLSTELLVLAIVLPVVGVAAIIVISLVYVRRSRSVNSGKEEKGLGDNLVSSVPASFVTEMNPDVRDASDEMVEGFDA